MNCFTIENLNFKYPNREEQALKNVNFSVAQGEIVTVCGLCGCGKTTLLRLLKPTLAPTGTSDGKILFFETLISELDQKEEAEQIGFLMQSVEEQIVTDKVWHELSFGLENLGLSNTEMRIRVSEIASFFGMEEWFHKETHTLSGGQKQILNLASLMVMQPTVLILDEPTAQLDPISAQEFLKILEKINRELGTTIILTEHRLEDVFPISDRVIFMDEGEVVLDDTPEKVGAFLKQTNHEMFSALPTPMKIHACIENEFPCPMTVREGKAWLDAYQKTHALHPENIASFAPSVPKEKALSLKDVWYRYEKEEKDILKGLTLSIGNGEIFSLLGGNGAGKSTLLSIISGCRKVGRGKIICNKKISMLPQNVKSLFSESTVFAELLAVLEEKNLSEDEKKTRAEDIANRFEIAKFLDVHPYDLSGGEQERLGLAKVLLTEPEILLLDEPTKGMDAGFKTELKTILKDLKNQGKTVLLVSHDLEFCAEVSDRCALLFDGAIASIDDRRAFFAGKSFYTTSANRMARHLLKNAVLAEDVISACGGTLPKLKKKRKEPNVSREHKKTEQTAPERKEKKKVEKRDVLSLIFLLFFIPITILSGMKFLEDRKVYFISLLVILEAMIPFLFLFERRKPKAREVVLLSVLCAICVAGRAAFFMLPQFKPTVAIVIITGVCFGGETGFLVGAISAFVSNFLFGQGPWTPWQMFALGIIGLLAGLIFYRDKKKKKGPMCVFGCFAAIFIYGGIMNPLAVLQTQSNPTFSMFLTAYLSGLSFDLVHAAATVFFLWVLSNPMIEKLARIKIKYGMIT